MWLFYYFNFEKNYGVLKSKSRCIFLNKNINFILKQNGIKIGIWRDESCAHITIVN